MLELPKSTVHKVLLGLTRNPYLVYAVDLDPFLFMLSINFAIWLFLMVRAALEKCWDRIVCLDVSVDVKVIRDLEIRR